MKEKGEGFFVWGRYFRFFIVKMGNRYGVSLVGCFLKFSIVFLVIYFCLIRKRWYLLGFLFLVLESVLLEKVVGFVICSIVFSSMVKSYVVFIRVRFF